MASPPSSFFESQVVEAIVSDIKMPRVDGFQLCHARRRDAGDEPRKPVLNLHGDAVDPVPSPC